MRALVLAAGLGTRLQPLTNDCPKALVEVGGRTLLELTLARLRSFGIHEVIVNAHHFAEKLISYLQQHKNFGMHIEISREEILLDTGGGIKHASSFLGASDEPFLVHNVDVLSTIDFGQMVGFHRQHQALVTLAVQHRPTSRYLLFDQDKRLCGRQAGVGGEPELTRPVRDFQALAFSGIHIVSTRIFSSIHEEGVFPIIPVYLRLAAEQQTVLGFPADEYYWRDLGRPGDISAAAADMVSGAYPD